MAIVVLMIAASGCDDNESPPPAATATSTTFPTRTATLLPSATATLVPTSTATLLPSPTPTTPGAQHAEILIGSSAAGGGKLAVDYDSTQLISLTLSACLGGTGDLCDGGFLVYSADDPGFEQLDENDPDHSLFALGDGTPLSIEITAIDSALSLKFEDEILNQPGQSRLLGMTPGFHEHAEYVLTLPGGAEPTGEYDLGLKLTTTSPAYTPSDEITVRFVPGPAESDAAP